MQITFTECSLSELRNKLLLSSFPIEEKFPSYWLFGGGSAIQKPDKNQKLNLSAAKSMLNSLYSQAYLIEADDSKIIGFSYAIGPPIVISSTFANVNIYIKNEYRHNGIAKHFLKHFNESVERGAIRRLIEIDTSNSPWYGKDIAPLVITGVG